MMSLTTGSQEEDLARSYGCEVCQTMGQYSVSVLVKHTLSDY